jgi:primosomal protein N' (replication factor Y)
VSDAEQLTLGPSRPARKRASTAVELAHELPVARVAVDVGLAHLDRPFDYLVPAAMDAAAQPGARVRVRFAGKLVDGFVLARVEATEHEGRLQPLARVVSAEPVLTEEIATLARAVADRYAGTLSDVLRLAIPARHARAERQLIAERHAPVAPTAPAEIAWADYVNGPEYLRALASGGTPRAVWTASPGADWAAQIAVAVRATAASGRGAVVVVPDSRDVARLDAAFAQELGPGIHVVLTADLGPEERYARWLAVARRQVRIVVGTRAAEFAPVADLGLVVCWDDGDDLHAEPRAPYPHVREVLVLRAHLAGAAALVGGFARTAEGERLLGSGWAHPLRAERAAVRAAAPHMAAAGSDSELARDPAARSARLPSLAWRAAQEGLAAGGPVLVQVPRRGYLPVLACTTCRAPARCSFCNGTLGADAAGHVSCRWCGHLAAGWTCPACGGSRWRAQVVGAGRTAEELGRAFPGVPVRTSGRDAVLDRVSSTPALVVATPGAEPIADGGYTAALLLDGWALLNRPDLRAEEEALRRWLNAAALVRPGGSGGRVIVMADAALRPVQALLRWDPASFAGRELAERQALGFPPAVRMAAITGSRAAVGDLLSTAELPETAHVLGPIQHGAEEVRALVRTPVGEALRLAQALHRAQGVRSARKAAGTVRMRIDPVPLG